MALLPGTKLGPYEIQELLGAGGMGEVYRARDTRLQRDVAIKILPASLADNADRLRRFEQEARAVAALSHPNLLTVFDVGTMPVAAADAAPGARTEGAGESPYLVSELLEGATLRERLASGALRERKAIDYSIQIARGLAAAHERGIVHRDIKPENIFVTNDGRVKILDFGLAKLTENVGGDPDATLGSRTQAGVVMGTVGYMSPEQVRGKGADARSDIFSFGAVVYEMLAGRRAFSGESSADVMSAILHQEPPELSASKQEISPAVERVVHHCMEKDAQQRFQSAGDIAFQLSELSGLRGTSGAQSVADGSGPAAGAKRRRPAMVAAIAVAALALLAGAWFVARATAHQTPPAFFQVTFQRGWVDSARFLPDGRNFVCAAHWGTSQEMALYTGSTDTPGMRPLGVAADAIASVSVAGEMLVVQNLKSVGPGYVRAGTLALMEPNGGAARPVLDSVQYADWAPDGKEYAVVRYAPEKRTYRLEYPAGKILYETQGWISDPRFSRDGRRIAFLDHPVFGDDAGSVAMVDLDGKKKTLSPAYGATQGLTWSPDGKEIWYSAAADKGYRGVFATTLSGRARPLLTEPGYILIQDARPDGRVLLQDLAHRRVLMVVTPEFPKPRDFSWLDWPYGMRFSSDGKQLLFGDQHGGTQYSTLLRNLDGSPAVRLGDGDPMDISADGKWALSRVQGEPEDLWLLPTGAGEPRQITHAHMNIIAARFLTDSRFYMNANEPNQRVRTFLVGLDGTVTPVTPEQTRALAATPDGTQLLTLNEETSQFELLPVAGGAAKPVPQLHAGDHALDFTPDGAGVLLAQRVSDGLAIEIWRVDLKSGQRTLLHTVQPAEPSYIANGFYVAVSRDGKSYAYQNHPATSTEYLIEGLQ